MYCKLILRPVIVLAMLAVTQAATAGPAADSKLHQAMAGKKGVYAPPFASVPRVSLCYSCGGEYPNYAGTIYTTGAAVERGGSCAGDLFYFEDSAPFLCTK